MIGFRNFILIGMFSFIGQSQIHAQTIAPESSRQADFGVLAELAGTVWGAGSEMHFQWRVFDKVLSADIINSNGEISHLEFRRSENGSKIILGEVGGSWEIPVKFPSKDSWEVRNSGKLIYGCRLTSKSILLVCDGEDENGRRYSIEIARSNEKARQAALAAASLRREKMLKGASELARQRKIWGPFADAMGVVDQEGNLNMVPSESKVIFGKINGNKSSATFKFEWKFDNNSQNYIMTITSILNDSIDKAPRTGDWTVQNGLACQEVFRRDCQPFYEKDGRLTGSMLSEVIGIKGPVSIVATQGGFEFIRADGRGVPVWKASFSKVQVGSYALAMRQYSSEWDRRLAKQRDDDGIAGMLLGALAGGALSGGAPNAILAGAQAMAPTDAMRDQLAASGAEIAARQRAQAADTAAFRARIADTVRANRPAANPMRDMGGASRTEAPRMTPQQQAQFDELERIKMREQIARGERPTTIAEDAQARLAGQNSRTDQGGESPGAGSSGARAASRTQVDGRKPSEKAEQRMTYVVCTGSQKATVFRSGKDQAGNREVLRFMFVHYTSRIGKISAEPGYVDALNRLSSEFRNQLPSIEAPDRYVSYRGGSCFEDPSYEQISIDIEENKRVWERDLGGKSSRDLISYENVLWTPG